MESSFTSLAKTEDIFVLLASIFVLLTKCNCDRQVRGMRCVGNVAPMWENRNACKISVGTENGGGSN